MARLLIGNVKGPQGDQGEQGVQGVPGNAATINVGSTTTSAYGTQARVTNVGTQSNAVFDFVIPQGAPGEETTTVGELTVDAITESVAEYPTYTVGEKMKVVLGKQLKYLNDLKTLTANQAQIITTLSATINNIVADGAGAHNSIYRGRYLGDHITAEQWAAIDAGTFEGLYIGDYWVINGKTWRIAAFDYFLHSGDTKCTTHHAVIVPDECLYNAQMNTTNDTTGGYAAVKNRGVLTDAETAIKAAFGTSHILSHRVHLTNAVSNGKPSGGAWFDTICDLMNEEMVYGTGIFRPTSDGSSVPANLRVEKSQLPLFAHEPSRIINRENYWLRDVVSAARFALVNYTGGAYYDNASYSIGVRPCFCICA